MGRRSPRILPPRWRVLTCSRPTYVRDDGYRIVLDAPGLWGLREPGRERPSTTFHEQFYAMEWVNETYPGGCHG